MPKPSSQVHESRLSGLLTHLYDAAIDDALWPGTAMRIAQAFGSSSAVLKFHGGNAQVNLLECTPNLIVSKREQTWADEWHRRDLWVDRSVAYGMSRVITDEDLVMREEQTRSGFYQEWLRHLGIYHMLGAVFPAADGAIGVLGIHRSRKAGAYTALERQHASLVFPHLQRTLRLRQRLATICRTHAATLQALDRFDTGVFIVDDACRIIYANTMAENLLRENKELGTTGQRLLPHQPKFHEKLLLQVRNAIDTARGGVAEPSVIIAIARPRRLPLTFEVAPLRPSMLPLVDQPCALIFVRDPEAPISVTSLRELFGLTRTEGVVATALGQGRSLEEIAVQMGIGLATVRSHLKRILAKTGTHRQAEVVALLARSVSTISN